MKAVEDEEEYRRRSGVEARKRERKVEERYGEEVFGRGGFGRSRRKTGRN